MGTLPPPTPPPPTPTVNATVAVDTATIGPFDVAMSTSFQPAEWDYQFFQSSLNAKTTLLGNLQPHHIRLQGISQGVPQGLQGTASTNWDFTILDEITQPVLTVGDNSPQFQIAKAPPFMYVNNDSNNSFSDLSFQQFAAYAQNLVRYYNQGGFTAPDGFHASPSGLPIQWWGIYNEPSINNHLNATEYTTMYNALVPKMQAAGNSLKFVALELCCFLSANPNLANVPVWITENNVNADFNKGGGISACNGSNFVTDRRGSSPFFAAWRPYVFSQVGKAGARALYHWDFDADTQFGEVDFSTGKPQLSYWVDYWLAQMFPAGSGQQILQFSNTDNSDIEVLPVLNTDGSVVIMISNHAVASASDNNGLGEIAKISLDVSALGSFTSATQLMIDSTTSAANGPGNPVSISQQSPIAVTINGYGVAILNLQ